MKPSDQDIAYLVRASSNEVIEQARRKRMEEFIPTTQRVRDRFINDSRNTNSAVADPGEAFDRWLIEQETAQREYDWFRVRSILDEYSNEDEHFEQVDNPEDGWRLYRDLRALVGGGQEAE